MPKPKINKLYFMSASKEWYDEIAPDQKVLRISGAFEVVIARDDDWARKVAFKQNSTFPKESWRIAARYSIESLNTLLLGPEEAIIPLGGTYDTSL